MEQIALLFISLAALAGLAFSQPPDRLVGRWQKRIEGTGLATVNYRPDGSYDAFVNGKSFISGRYVVTGDTIRMTDGFCNPAYPGTYRLEFFGLDSVRFQILQDTCRRRSFGTNGLTLGRIRPDQTK